MAFDSRSALGWVTFHLLDIAAVLVLAGVFLFLAWRLRDPGALAVERSNDFLAPAGLSCRRCGEAFASVLQMDDLKDVLPQVGFDYSLPGGGNYQDHCPACRRRLVTLAQSRAVGGFG